MTHSTPPKVQRGKRWQTRAARTQSHSQMLRMLRRRRIAAVLGACSAADEQAVLALGLRLKDVLSRLVH